ncbi:hypothetical protein [Alkalicoccus chagannorensis]|uniref:hypothetical protein n=1 Tax=Alkalicoccus chagannorensis TaxID=427072 RepID=UPI000405A106|nr:hypothetical protein [Alkalicoccus chagannorensis]
MFLLAVLFLIAGAWLLIRIGVKRLFHIQEADAGFFGEAVSPAHQRIRLLCSMLYLLLGAGLLLALLDLSILPWLLYGLAGVVVFDGAARMIFDRRSHEPQRAALTLIDVVLIVAAILFGISQLPS